MGKKKIIVSPDILSEYSPQEQLNDISLKFVITNEYHKLNIDLTSLLNGNLERRKEIHKFKEFLVKTPKSLSTKKTYYKVFKKMILYINANKINSLIQGLEKYVELLIDNFEKKIISYESYKAYQGSLKIIFTDCYNMRLKDFVKIFPEYIKKTGKLDNATILDNHGKEKSFSKSQFKEISKIFLRLHDFFDSLLVNDSIDSNILNFEYLNMYKLDIDLRWKSEANLKNRRTFCLMVVLICLTGLNLTPLIRMKRSDIIIDKERKMISFQTTCNRKNKLQSHTYPMRDNQLKFFEKIINNSLDVDPTQDILFPFISITEIIHFNHAINKMYDFFNTGFCGEYKGFNITARKLRHSFGSQFDEIDLRSVALFNNINTAARNYSTGNLEENNFQLQNAMNIYTIALSNSEDIQTVRENINKINVINIKDITSLKQENSQITSSGIFCINSKEGKEPETFSRKMENLQLDNIESINCANILACFNCKNSIIVNDFENTYLLKSFYNYLNKIIYESDTSSLFSDKNAVKNALVGISLILDNKLDKKIINKVDKYIIQNGNHPLWEINGEFI